MEESEVKHTITNKYKFGYGIDENGDEYTDITTTRVYSRPPYPDMAPSHQTIRYMKALNLLEILEIVKADELAQKAALNSIKAGMGDRSFDRGIIMDFHGTVPPA